MELGGRARVQREEAAAQHKKELSVEPLKEGQSVWGGREHPPPRTRMEAGGPFGGDAMEAISTQLEIGVVAC